MGVGQTGETGHLVLVLAEKENRRVCVVVPILSQLFAVETA